MTQKFATALLGFVLFVSNSAQARDCDFRLDEKVVSIESNIFVIFDRVEPNHYVVKGAYLRSGDRYRQFRNYMVEWPSYAPGTAYITEVQFKEYSSGGCGVTFVGERSSGDVEKELYEAGYSEASGGLMLEWPETENLLPFAPIDRSDIAP